MWILLKVTVQSNLKQTRFYLSRQCHYCRWLQPDNVNFFRSIYLIDNWIKSSAKLQVHQISFKPTTSPLLIINQPHNNFPNPNRDATNVEEIVTATTQCYCCTYSVVVPRWRTVPLPSSPSSPSSSPPPLTSSDSPQAIAATVHRPLKGCCNTEKNESFHVVVGCFHIVGKSFRVYRKGRMKRIDGGLVCFVGGSFYF